MLQQSKVGEIAGRNFVSRHLKFGQEIGTWHIESGSKKSNTDLCTITLQLKILLASKLKKISVFPISRAVSCCD